MSTATVLPVLMVPVSVLASLAAQHLVLRHREARAERAAAAQMADDIESWMWGDRRG